ncbi:PREDICTED: uncharacterized protein LOC102015193 isoform X2 [Chinchilla lanigera]|uniref:uncharacterized protein LOC102015193 isoform X2 n=1 Tax=Chinchilla lanigera TaxID=34839 RepID=UPI000698D866|nr:PREDICTED: uncharacterized protein LOC102015193 isoform X2 [Chinchilla lanigera]
MPVSGRLCNHFEDDIRNSSKGKGAEFRQCLRSTQVTPHSDIPNISSREFARTAPELDVGLWDADHWERAEDAQEQPHAVVRQEDITSPSVQSPRVPDLSGFLLIFFPAWHDGSVWSLVSSWGTRLSIAFSQDTRRPPTRGFHPRSSCPGLASSCLTTIPRKLPERTSIHRATAPAQASRFCWKHVLYYSSACPSHTAGSRWQPC